MTTPLNLYLCLEDPPNFRKEISDCENSVFGLEITIKNFVKLARASVELASEYTAKQLKFAEEFGNFAKQQPESIIKTVLLKYANSLQEVERSRKILQSHMYDMFIEPLEAFAKNEIIPLKDMKKATEKASYEVDSALSKYMSKRPRDITISEASIEVSETRKEFHDRCLNYVIKINELEAKKKFEFIEYILALMFTESSFYHQCYEILKDMENHMKDVTRLLHESRTKYNKDVKDSRNIKKSILEKSKESYNPLHSYKKSTKDLVSLGENYSPVTKSGYLFMKRNQRVMQTWTRKYFFISNGQLFCVGRGGKEENEMGSIILRLCHIKPVDSLDRRFCFEIISPNKTCTLQAENQKDMEDWIFCLQTAAQYSLYSDSFTIFVADGSDKLQEALQDTYFNDHNSKSGVNGHVSRSKKSIMRIKKLAGNDVCVDCRSKDPQWASTNFGTLLCIECSGIHRSLGVHISKVRSLMLDKWEPESLGVMLKLGNLKTNSIYEAKLSGDHEIITTNSTSWGRYILGIRKVFKISKEDEIEASVDLSFWNAMSESNIYEALKNLSLGANVDWKNEERNSTTALHQAILRNDNVSVEFLLQWFCDINEVDNDGWSGLHHAAATNNSRLLLTLMKRHADIHLKDRKGKVPVDIAVELQHVQAVTALRLYQFENQLTRKEYSKFGVDEALTSVNKPPYISHSSSSSLDLRSPVTTIITNNNYQAKSAPTTPPLSSSALLSMDDAELISKSIIIDEIFSEKAAEDLGITGLVTSRFSLASLKLPSFGNTHKGSEEVIE
ncbi:13628_t:CDS:10 [Funneliformis geosporum]|uniref:13628_t:CDS:1 n=1 Tax=Funneliformis geosporum TaxID=1117311 RepID=A0A9W4SNB7_9GLOM|nr:13628_t:CDS:10 [Funneliformis geosporum]